MKNTCSVRFHLPGADSILLPSDNPTFDPVNKRTINQKLAKVFLEYVIDGYKILTHKKILINKSYQQS